ncbi:MAG: hypothetical protein NZ958_05950 [Bacteroidia bacterium]|nr:hypothetical protein [Bacteroidia bacterium]MDW8088839.1 hypothetical protein [Bacteroidia bacterium]
MRWVSLFGAGLLLGQTPLDAERWSQSQPQGSARALGMGGAFAALGGDPANFISNPAGLGLFVRSGVWLTPALTVPTTTTTYLGEAKDGTTALGISQGAVILHTWGKNQNIHGSFGLGYDREGYFTQNSLAKGFNRRNSYTQFLAELAEGTPDTLLINLGPPALAYANYFQLTPGVFRGILDPLGNNRYRGVFNEGNVLQEIATEETGRMGTWSLGGALSYQNVVFVGASLLIRTLRYSKLFRLREIDTENRYDGSRQTTPADEVVFREKYTSDGSGIGLSLGVLVEPLPYLRAGVSFITGSRLTIRDETNGDSEFALDDGRRQTVSYQEPFQFEYTYIYPYRLCGGVAFIVPGKGALSIEGDFLDYRTTGFASGQYSYDREKEEIRRTFSTAFNIRAGLEWLITTQLALRAGYAYYSPVQNAEGRQYYADYTQPRNLTTLATQRQFFSLGAGYSMGSFSIDIAYQYSLGAMKYLPYALRDPAYAPAPIVVIRRQMHAVFITVGVRF